MASRKRGQSEGSIFRRKDGRWSGQVSLGNGRRKSVYARTASEVRVKVAEIQATMSQGIQLPKRMTITELTTLWLAAKENTVRPLTFENYSLTIRKHVTPNMGSMKIAKVTPSDFERLYADCTAVISPKTIRNLHAILKQAFDWAVRRDWIARNPARLIATTDLPKVVRKPPVVLSPEEARKLIDTAVGTKSEALIALAVTTGARVGELMGLTWDRVTLPDERKPDKPSVVRIDRALQYVDGEPVLVEPKTPAGVRDLTLTPTASNPLRQLRSEQNKTALRLGTNWSNPLDLVFVTETGQPLNRRAVLKQYFRPLLNEAGLPAKMKFHTLRHAAASLLLADGVPVPLVSKMLGHSTPAFTMAIYSHAIPNSEHIVASAMESILGN
jgi:integrase